jgi:hypothetical protein
VHGDLADIHYPDADRIRVVMDNLSTHTTRALYEAFPAPETHRVTHRLEFHYTPKHASWRNMVEIEIGVLRGQCLGRRIGEREVLLSEIDAWQRQRNESGARIKWKFTTQKARHKLARAYPDTAKESQSLCRGTRADRGARRQCPSAAIRPDLTIMLQEDKAELLVMLTAPASEREMLRPTATAAMDLGALPTGPCQGCGGGLWWRVSERQMLLMPATNGRPCNGMERLDAADEIVALDRELRCSEPMNGLVLIVRLTKFRPTTRRPWHRLKTPPRSAPTGAFQANAAKSIQQRDKIHRKVEVVPPPLGRNYGWSQCEGEG